MKYLAAVLLLLGSMAFSLAIDSDMVNLSQENYNNWNETLAINLMLGWALLIVFAIFDIFVAFKKEN